MGEEIDHEARVRLSLLLAGFAPGREHHNVEKILDEFGANGILPNLRRDEFFVDLYKVWAAKSTGRTVRYIDRRMKELGGPKSAYHRISGRLRRSKAGCAPTIKMFLTEWTEEKGRKNPHPLINTDEKITAFVDILFRQEDLEKRVNSEGLNSADLEYLQTVQKLLQRPIRIRELILLLQTRR
ncbi:MAG TPA: hypothetical protein VGP13_02490 [Candidatus Paceibacterota bacterium]|jgi:hypothetical protein|nr:hypothetical protein [Candidatus Paceibacterota bacterium]